MMTVVVFIVLVEVVELDMFVYLFTCSLSSLIF